MYASIAVNRKGLFLLGFFEAVLGAKRSLFFLLGIRARNAAKYFVGHHFFGDLHSRDKMCATVVSGKYTSLVRRLQLREGGREARTD